jgi:hypothetical protein
MERARQYEYQLLADRLLGIVGGSIGLRYDPANPVLIAVGLGKFLIRSGLSSLDSTFFSYFVQKVTVDSRMSLRIDTCKCLTSTKQSKKII